MSISDDAPGFDRKYPVEQRLCKSGAPGTGGAQRLGGLECKLDLAERPVSLDHIGRAAARQPPCDFSVKGARKLVQISFGKRQTGSHRVAAELLHQLRRACGNRIEHVADVYSGNRAGRTTELAIVGAGKRHHWTAQPLLDSACNEAHHTLMPMRIEQAHAGT